MLYNIAVVLLLLSLPLAIGVLLLVDPAAPSSSAQSLPDLAIVNYVDPGEEDPFAPGNEIAYGIYVINWSIYPANDVYVIVTLPEHTTYVTSSGPGFVLIQAGPDQVVWVRDRLTDFEQAWLSVTVRVDDDAPVGAGAENRAYIFCLDPESNYENNEHSVKNYVRPAEPEIVGLGIHVQHQWMEQAQAVAPLFGVEDLQPPSFNSPQAHLL